MWKSCIWSLSIYENLATVLRSQKGQWDFGPQTSRTGASCSPFIEEAVRLMSYCWGEGRHICLCATGDPKHMEWRENLEKKTGHPGSGQKERTDYNPTGDWTSKQTGHMSGRTEQKGPKALSQIPVGTSLSTQTSAAICWHLQPQREPHMDLVRCFLQCRTSVHINKYSSAL